MLQKKRLGRGLDALLSTSNKETPENDIISTVDISRLQIGNFQPRININNHSLQELANSIKSQGIIQPIIVRSIKDNKYEIIAGERRFQAAKIANLHNIPIVIKEIDDNNTLIVALIENIQRDDLLPLEEAKAFARLIKEFDMTHNEIAKVVGKSRSNVSNILRLLQLNDNVKILLNDNKLEMGHARALLSLNNIMQLKIANQIIANKLNVRQSEALVKNILIPKISNINQTSAYILKLGIELSKKLSVKIKINSTKNSTNLNIKCSSEQELQQIINKINNSIK